MESGYVIFIFVHPVGPSTEKTPYTGFANTRSFEIQRAVGGGEIKIFIFTFIISFFSGKADNVFGIEAVVFIILEKLANATLVGVATDAVVGNAYGYPESTFATGAFANHFHNPRFFRICNGEGLSFAGITVLCCE